jgi:hypothetical protein
MIEPEWAMELGQCAVSMGSLSFAVSRSFFVWYIHEQL